ncbi:MAG: hypothetical protein KBD31_04395, partial [Proteobacteria bacterium]|nr:hypothetical protein [Pseudomonadota bacterium]
MKKSNLYKKKYSRFLLRSLFMASLSLSLSKIIYATDSVYSMTNIPQEDQQLIVNSLCNIYNVKRTEVSKHTKDLTPIRGEIAANGFHRSLIAYLLTSSSCIPASIDEYINIPQEEKEEHLKLYNVLRVCDVFVFKSIWQSLGHSEDEYKNEAKNIVPGIEKSVRILPKFLTSQNTSFTEKRDEVFNHQDWPYQKDCVTIKPDYLADLLKRNKDGESENLGDDDYLENVPVNQNSGLTAQALSALAQNPPLQNQAAEVDRLQAELDVANAAKQAAEDALANANVAQLQQDLQAANTARQTAEDALANANVAQLQQDLQAANTARQTAEDALANANVAQLQQ